MSSLRIRQGLCLGFAVLVMVGLAASAWAQLSAPTPVLNGGNSADLNSTSLAPAFVVQNFSTVNVQSTSSAFFSVHYAALCHAASAFTNQSRTHNADYTVSFTATAPTTYKLLVSTTFKGAMTVVSVGGSASSAAANVSGVTGGHTGGTLVTPGTLDVADPGSVSSGSSTNSGFELNNNAMITGVSNNAPIAHTLSFTFNAACSTTSSGAVADHSAVRLGIGNSNVLSTAEDYPGAGARVIGDDGHFVRVTLVSDLCGDNAITTGETCDDGNQDNGDGCNSSCLIEDCYTCVGVGDMSCSPLMMGSACGDATDDACTNPDTCDGMGFCQANHAEPGETCTSDGNVCTVDACDGEGSCQNTPGNSGTVCRAAADACDVAETCDGTNAACPSDVLATGGTICRASAGVCDVAETCSGTAASCPADAFVASGTECRADAGQCDIAEACTGGAAACPPDAFEANGTTCDDGNAQTQPDACENGACVGAAPFDPSQAVPAASPFAVLALIGVLAGLAAKRLRS